MCKYVNSFVQWCIKLQKKERERKQEEPRREGGEKQGGLEEQQNNLFVEDHTEGPVFASSAQSPVAVWEGTIHKYLF